MLNWLAKIKCALDFLARFCKRKAHRRVLHRSCVFTYRFAFMKHRIYFYYASINKQMMQWRRPIWSLALHIGESRNASLRAFRVWTVFDLLLAYRDKILSTNSVFLLLLSFLAENIFGVRKPFVLETSAFYRHRPQLVDCFAGRNM